MRVPRRRTVGVVIVLCTLAVVWAPSLIATGYQTDAQPVSFLTRPDKGWHFLYDSVRLSRRSRLGTEGSALAAAKRIWSRPTRVELVYLERPLNIPVPLGGLVPTPSRRLARTPHRLAWLVHGRIGNRPQQIVGVLDFVGGGLVWDVVTEVRRGRA